MQENDRLNTPPRVFTTEGQPRTCYRCGKREGEQRPLRLLPGSAHIIVCPECYQVLWGWKEEKGT